MEITHQELDALNTVVTIELAQEDFADKVAEVLKDYRKNANIPGFRKGHVPMGMIKKQYETPVKAEEVNKLLKENLEKYLKEKEFQILGNPLPKMQEDIDWKAASLKFEFELGISPVFEIDLKSRKKVTQYKIEADKKMINEQLQSIQKQYGKLIAQIEVEEGFEITAHFQSEALGIDNTATFEFDSLKGKKNKAALKGQIVGASLALESKGLFESTATAQRLLGISNEQAEALKGALEITLKEVNQRELATLDQELFDKLYEPGTITSEAELKAKIKEGIEKQFEQQSDQKLLNDMTEFLVDNTKFDLPAEFLTRWIQTSGEKELTADEAKEEYKRSEKGIRYQLIEGKLVEDNELQVQFDELKDFAREMIGLQMAQYGQMPPEEKEMEGIILRILSNQEESRRLQDQLMSQKMLAFYKNSGPIKEKAIAFDAFIKEAYGQA